MLLKDVVCSVKYSLSAEELITTENPTDSSKIPIANPQSLLFGHFVSSGFLFFLDNSKFLLSFDCDFHCDENGGWLINQLHDYCYGRCCFLQKRKKERKKTKK